MTEGPLGLTAMQAQKIFQFLVASIHHFKILVWFGFFSEANPKIPLLVSTQVTCVPSKDTEEALRGLPVHLLWLDEG